MELIEIDYGLDSAPRLIPVESSDKRIRFVMEVELRLEVYAHFSSHRRRPSELIPAPDTPSEEVFEAKQQGSVALTFIKENGCWKYAGHEQPVVGGFMSFAPSADYGAKAVLEKYR